jgi:hypothetical protein
VLAVFDGDAAVGAPGSWRGVRSRSTWPWTWSWTRVSDQQRFHGSHRTYVAPSGLVVNGGAFGIETSTDRGLTWENRATSYSAIVVGTATHLYSSTNYASRGEFAPRLQRSDATGVVWEPMEAPERMFNGPRGAAVTNDGEHYVIITGNWMAGVWRYVEP